MIYAVDIDNTICFTDGSDYLNSKPRPERISVINKLYMDGHTIIYWTARGSISGQDWYDFTNKQLEEWGCLKHKLIIGKPSYDLFIDDKAIASDSFFI